MNIYEIRIIPMSLRLQTTPPYCVYVNDICEASFFFETSAIKHIDSLKEDEINRIASNQFLECHENSNWLKAPFTKSYSGMGVPRR